MRELENFDKFTKKELIERIIKLSNENDRITDEKTKILQELKKNNDEAENTKYEISQYKLQIEGLFH